jgi:hypothetical protein
VKLGNIISDFYEAYLNACAPSLYYNSSASATIIGTLSTLLYRVKVSNVHAIALGALLFLLAILLSVTQSHKPLPGCRCIER